MRLRAGLQENVRSHCLCFVIRASSFGFDSGIQTSSFEFISLVCIYLLLVFFWSIEWPGQLHSTSLSRNGQRWFTRSQPAGRSCCCARAGFSSKATKIAFSITHSEFLLFPTYLHQSRGELKAEVELESAAAEPEQVHITAAGVVTDIIKVESRAQVDRLDDQHIWAPSLIDMRFNYKPQNPLYLVLVRAFRLHDPIVLPNTPAYAGCKSWVPLQQPIATGAALPVLDDLIYEHSRETILARLNP